MSDAVLELLKPYVVEILDALKAVILSAIALGGTILLAKIRARFQTQVAGAAVLAEEKAALKKTSATGDKVPGEVKKQNAVAAVAAKLPWHAKPILPGGIGRLVEKQVDALKRESQAPKE